MEEEEKRKKEKEEKEKQRERQEQGVVMANTPFKTSLTTCVEVSNSLPPGWEEIIRLFLPPQERDQLRKELDELTVKIRGIVKDFPAVAYRLGFLQNFTHTQKPPLTGDSVVKEDSKIETVEVVDEKRKHEGTEVNGERADRPRPGEEEDAEKKKSLGGLEEPEDAQEDQLDFILKEV